VGLSWGFIPRFTQPIPLSTCPPQSNRSQFGKSTYLSAGKDPRPVGPPKSLMVWPGTERPLRSVITTGFAWVRWLGDTTDDILRHTTSTVQERIPPSIKTEGDDIHSGPLNGPLTIGTPDSGAA
jgi:hypothetical protein